MPRSPIIVPPTKRRPFAGLVDAVFDKLAVHLIPLLARQYEGPPTSATDEREGDEDCMCPDCLQALRDEGDERGCPLSTKTVTPRGQGMNALSPENPLRVFYKVSTNPINLADLIANFHTVLPHAEADALGLSPDWTLVIRLFNGGGIVGTTMPLFSALMMLDHFTYNGEYSLLVVCGHPALNAEVLALAFSGWLTNVQRTYDLFDAARAPQDQPTGAGGGTQHLRILPPAARPGRDDDAPGEPEGDNRAPSPAR